jgi:ABC-2 type transport system ATP-binding protein
MSALAFENLHVSVKANFWTRPLDILRGVSFEVQEGEIFGFLGPNGAGKTTTIKTLLGLITPDKGEAKILGQNARHTEARRHLGFMPERAYYPAQLSAREMVSAHAALAGVASKDVTSKTQAVLKRVGLLHAADRRSGGYSKGMLQRLGFAQALVGEPKVVVLDEPLSGLDPVGRRALREIMVSLRDQGKTVFFSTHILPDVESVCDRVAILVGGQVRQIGPLESLLEDRTKKATFEIICAAPTAETFDNLSPTPLKSERLPTGDAALTIEGESQANALLAALLKRGATIKSLQRHGRSLEELLIDETQKEAT